jgi:hypothetical protein
MPKKSARSADDSQGGKKSRPGYPVFARLDEEVGACIEDYLDAQRVRPTLTALLEASLKEFLKSVGFYPRRKPKGGAE